MHKIDVEPTKHKIEGSRIEEAKMEILRMGPSGLSEFLQEELISHVKTLTRNMLSIVDEHKYIMALLGISLDVKIISSVLDAELYHEGCVFKEGE